jgi:hypothetical protein
LQCLFGTKLDDLDEDAKEWLKAARAKAFTEDRDVEVLEYLHILYSIIK